MEKTVIISTICFLATILVASLFIYPTYKDIKATQFEIDQRKLDIEWSKEKISHYTQLLEKINQYQESLEKIETALPPDPALPSLFSDLRSKLGEAGFILKDISVSPPIVSAKKEIKSIELKVKATGDYQGLKNFLSLLEKSGRIIDPENIIISTQTLETEEVLFFELALKAYFY